MLAKDSYVLSEYQQEISKLSQKNKQLEIAFFKRNSLKNKEVLEGQNFVKVDEVDYIRIPEASVVTNK